MALSIAMVYAPIAQKPLSELELTIATPGWRDQSCVSPTCLSYHPIQEPKFFCMVSQLGAWPDLALGKGSFSQDCDLHIIDQHAYTSK